jgi:hypothetical protein
MTLDIGVWVAWLLTIFAFSAVLYKDNILFKFAQYTFVGVSIGYTIAMGVKTILDTAWTPVMHGEYVYIIPIILGFMLFLRFKKGLESYSEWAMAFLIAVGAALAIRGNVHAYFLEQIQATMLPVIAEDPTTSFNNVIIIIGTLTSMLYFIMTREHKGILKYPTRIGRIFIMIAFGAFFAGLIMTRLTLIYGRIKFILQTLGLV